MNVNYLVCPNCQHELEVRTTTTDDKCVNCGVPEDGKHHRPTHPGVCVIETDIPKEMSKEFNEYIEERDTEMLSEWSSRWQ